ncbi:hypothetical protein [Pinibacter aurantiacus]|uniref:Helix-turn-helix domain-containing protein n=1 Tax=Pinibacter aurantiacus TaxID=2851599 RepID=A0A9E2S620_9BACT|nr:hypothetical protein [Pinibacter aurantiacus]MBV4357308.1 hypothetical protein [Pinibacter aurantiacus]
MNIDKLVYEFMDVAREDPTMGPSHISLYLTIVFMYQQHDRKMPIEIKARQLMVAAKIKSAGTYYKYLQNLIEKRFISYQPSRSPVTGSLITINEKLD